MSILNIRVDGESLQLQKYLLHTNCEFIHEILSSPITAPYQEYSQMNASPLVELQSMLMTVASSRNFSMAPQRNSF